MEGVLDWFMAKNARLTAASPLFCAESIAAAHLSWQKILDSAFNQAERTKAHMTQAGDCVAYERVITDGPAQHLDIVYTLRLSAPSPSDSHDPRRQRGDEVPATTRRRCGWWTLISNGAIGIWKVETRSGGAPSSTCRRCCWRWVLF